MSKKMEQSIPDRNRPLPSKLTPPRLPKIVPRARLFRELDRARTRPIIWIAAPPGAGKTTLVASYLHARRLRPLWYTVDERDGDLATFFHYLSLAARPLAPRKSPLLPHLTPEYLQGVSVFTRNVFEALDAQLPRSIALVLDNYQTIPAGSPVHEMVALGLSHLAMERPVLIISREEPPPAWASLLASRRMTMMDSGILRLTSAESCALIALYRSRRRDASAERALTKAAATLDGWMAGLVLLLEEATGSSATVASQEPSRQALFNYLGAEVFARMDVRTQDVLLSTAYCPVVTGVMATELSGHRDAESYLETLYRRRYFVERHDGTPVSYTYHPLLQEFLQHRLQQDWSTEGLLTLRTKTAHLLSTAGQVEAAVDLSIDAQDHEAVAHAIISHAPSFLRQGRFAVIQQWLQTLPPERCASDPWLLYWSACSTPPANAAMLEQIHAQHEQAYRQFETRGELVGQVLAWVGVVKAIIYSWDRFGRVDSWMEIGERWLKNMPADLPAPVRFEFISALLAVFAWPHFGSPLVPLVREELDRLLPSIDDPVVLAAAYVPGTVIDLCGGTNHHAKNYFSTRIRNRLGENLPPLARLMRDHAEGHTLWHRGDMERALASADPIIELCHGQGIYFLIGWVAGVAAYPRLMLNRPQDVLRYLAMVRPHYDHLAPFQQGYLHFLTAWQAYLVEDFRSALRECKQADTLNSGVQCPLGEAEIRVGWAMTYHALGNDDEAHRLLASLEAQVQVSSNYLLGRCLWLLAKARLHLDAGQESDGLPALREGLALAAETGQHYLPWGRPDETARLLVRALEEQIEPAFVRLLIRNLQIKPVGIAWYSTAWPWAIKVYTLGKFEILVNDRPLQFTRKVPRKTLGLLQAIIAHGGQQVPAETLCDRLWPESDGDQAYQALTTELNRLRVLLKHKEAVTLQENRLSLNQTLCWVDALSFEQLAKESLLLMEQGKQEQSEHLVKQARSLYTGEFLPTPDHLPWLHPTRDRLARTASRLGIGHSVSDSLVTER
ncbi:hypothetical protein [Nitrospira sp. BLG_1]|uniref:hypothetical protein n=1 Tax=Nitrospira sp. BLG_1 TaxID=3395883 RepID=UPI0039BCFBD9